jgi:predicted ATPase
MSLTLRAQNYRLFSTVAWEIPRGVSLLVGPNGSGKTTLLDLLELLRHALEGGMQRAIEHHGGAAWLRYRGAEPTAPVQVGCGLDDVTWEVDLSAVAARTGDPATDRLFAGGKLVAEQTGHERHFTSAGGRLAPDPTPLPVRIAGDPAYAHVLPLVATLSGYRLYRPPQVQTIRESGSPYSSDTFLHPSGRNVFSVLRNWRDRRETRARWDFVIEGLRQGFPGLFVDLDFEVAGQMVTARIQAPRFDEMMPVHLAPEGWFMALLHLAAVASVERGGVVGIDEPENGLHPYAMRRLVETMSDWAAEQQVHILLATHSPVLLDQFKREPERVFVMEPGAETLPARLDVVHTRDWLAHFSLGDLYMHEEFGAQDPSAR